MKLTKVIASILTATTMLSINPIGASAEWKLDSNGWWNKEGSSWSIGWKEIDGKWYYFGHDGYMKHDTIIDGYRLGSDGAWIEDTSNNLSNLDKVTTNEDRDFNIEEFKNKLKTEGFNVEVRNTLYDENKSSTGWKLVNGKYYFFSFSGSLAKDTIVDGYYVGDDGALITTKCKSKLQDITMKTEKIVYPIGTKSIKVNIENNTDLESDYGGSYYRIYKFENNEWSNLDFCEDTSFNEVDYILPAKGKNHEEYSLSLLKDFNNLTAGKYRISAEIENSAGYSHVTAEFELQ